MYKTQLNLQQ